jgi:hypothetical protein
MTATSVEINGIVAVRPRRSKNIERPFREKAAALVHFDEGIAVLDA